MGNENGLGLPKPHWENRYFTVRAAASLPLRSCLTRAI
jgi:hypothetical protein